MSYDKFGKDRPVKMHHNTLWSEEGKERAGDTTERLHLTAYHTHSHHYRNESRKVTPAGPDRVFIKEEQN
jgi:hypothetical protein